MHAHQDALLGGHVAAHQDQMTFRVQVAAVGKRAEFAKLGFDGAFRQAANEALGFHAVANEVRHRDHLQVVVDAEFAELRHARHGAVVIHDLTDDAGGRQTGETGEVDGRLRLAGAHQHAAFARAQGEDMAGPRQVLGPAFRVNGGEDGAGAVGGGDAGGDAGAGVDRFAKSGTEIGSILGTHERQPEVVAAFRREGQADEPAAIGGHEIDDLGGDFFGGDGEVSLVFPVFIVHHHQHAAGANLLNSFRNPNKRHNSLYPARRRGHRS